MSFRAALLVLLTGFAVGCGPPDRDDRGRNVNPPDAGGCVPETDAALCDAQGLSCGAATIKDRCDFTRVVTCGRCDAPLSCISGSCREQVACTAEDDCPDGLPCVDGTCGEVDVCGSLECPAGLGCNPASGTCADLCTLPTAERCTLPQSCDSATGRCIDRCAGVTCANDTLACNPASALCEAKCETPTKPRGAAACSANQVCEATTGRCVNVNLCQGVSCSAGQRCDAATGACVANCAGITCSSGQRCEPSTGACVANCTGVTCSTGQRCEPSTGACVANCAGVTCNSGQSCDPATGACVSSCNGVTCPSGQKCNPATASCVPNCTGVTCPSGQKCNPSNGACIANCSNVVCPVGFNCNAANGQCVAAATAQTGDACTSTSQCNIPGASNPACLQSVEGIPLPGGYCAGSCSSVGVSCPQGSLCFEGTTNRCMKTCTRNADCRSGYSCELVGGSQWACLPTSTCTRSPCSPLGGDCEVSTDCFDGGYCLRETTSTGTFSGFEDGMCVALRRYTDSCPAGSLGLSVISSEPELLVCIKTCSAGSVTQCRLGETCTETGSGSVCWMSSCAADEGCDEASCSSTDTSLCGMGQTCSGGYCRTADRCQNGTCPRGGTCDLSTGECRNYWCEVSTGSCYPDCNLYGGCPSGTTCTGTGRCERSCSSDGACGANAYCSGGVCAARCTDNTPWSVCGARGCNTATGRCY